MIDEKVSVFIIDDDEAIRNGLSMLLQSYGYDPRPFASGNAFLARCMEPLPDRCVAIVDLSMPEIDGLDLQQTLLRRHVDVPLVFLSGEGNIPAAVNAMQHGAIDFMEKPVNSELLIETIETALAGQECRHRNEAANKAIQVQLDSLTPREREVLDNIAAGRTSKATAYDLGISERTVELHRSRILRKMGVRNSSELLNRVIPQLTSEAENEG